jgi:hypothetical protein
MENAMPPTKESEIETMQIPIDTDKFQAISVYVGAPANAEPSIVWGLLMDVLAVYQIYHRGLEWIDRQVFKLDERKAKQNK